jgi:hypothetical protein
VRHILFSCILILGCGGTGPKEELPETWIVTGPTEGSILSQPEVSLEWDGNEFAAEFSYRFDPDPWSEWTPEKSKTFILDEGPYTFWAKSRNESGVEDDTPAGRSFNVDAVEGPALTVRPRLVDVSSGDNLTIQVFAEEVSALMLAHPILRFDPEALSIEKAEGDSFLAQNGGTVLFFADIDVEAGILEISTGVGGGEPSGVDGSGPLATVTFRAQTPGTAALSYDTLSEFRDPQNRTIPIKEFIGGSVAVE